MRNVLKFSLFAVLLWGCGGGKDSGVFVQDPLSGYPDSVKNGLPPEGRPNKPDLAGICRDCYQITVNNEDPVSAQEGEEMKTAIEVVLYKKQIPLQLKSFRLELLNAADFPGARMVLEKEVPLSDPNSLTAEQKYILTWTPAPGITGTTANARKFAELRLSVDGAVKTATQRTFAIDISKLFKNPVVRSVRETTGQWQFFEGRLYNFDVAISDPDGVLAEPSQLRFSQPAAGTDPRIAELFQVTSVVQDPATGNFVYRVSLDLRNREVLKNDAYFSVEVTAINRFTKVSAPFSFSLNLSSVPRDPIASLQATPLEVVRGQVIVHTFTILDPGNQGTVNAVILGQPSGFPGTINLVCGTPAGTTPVTWMKNCELSTRVNASAFPQTFNLNIDIRNSEGTQTRNVTRTVPLRIVNPVVTTTTTTTTTTFFPSSVEEGGVQ